MPTDATILMIRHAEKPLDRTDPTLSSAGHARACADVSYFQHYRLHDTPLRLAHLFAAADSAHSQRPRLTITPLAHALQLPINAEYADADYAVCRRHVAVEGTSPFHRVTRVLPPVSDRYGVGSAYEPP